MKNFEIIQKDFAQKMENMALTYQSNKKEYFQSFIQKQSLYSKFKELASKLEQDVEIDDCYYCEILQDFMSSKELFSFKKAELIQAWILYQFMMKFTIRVDISKMIQVVKKIFNEKKISLRRYVEETARNNFPKQMDFQDWKKHNKSQVEKFETLITTSLFYQSFKSLEPGFTNEKQYQKQELSKMEELSSKIKRGQVKQQVKQQVRQQIRQQQQSGKADFGLMQLQKEGSLIMLQYDQLLQYPNLLQLELQKHILANFIEAYERTPKHNKEFYNLLAKYLPIKIKSIQEIKSQLQRQKRPVSQSFQRLSKLMSESQPLQMQQELNKYKQIYRGWSYIKQQLSILNIFLLKHLVYNTEQSIKHIKDKNILFLIGPSGAGKTTIILRLLNYQLQETQINELPTLAPKRRLNYQHSELICSPEAKSTTKYIFSAKINPQFVSERQVETQDGQTILVKEDLYLCDTPGFFDTSGAVVDIANGVGMINAVKVAKTVKPIVVISASMVGEKFEGIKQIGKIVSDLFNEYRKKQQGASTQFIFNKFNSNKQFDRLQPGLVNILNNLSATQQSDIKYVRFLQILYERLKKKKGIIRFDPFKVNIKEVIKSVADRPLQNPNKAFKYSFSSKSVLTLKNYYQNKLNIILSLLNEDVRHACYHIKQIKSLLTLVPNQDYDNDYKNLIERICNTTKEYFQKFKYILEEGILKNEASSSQIEELKFIYEALKKFNAFSIFPEIYVYQEKYLLNFIERVSNQLQDTYKQYPFMNIKQAQYKKLIKIIKCFGQNLNAELLNSLKAYLGKKYLNFQEDIDQFINDNRFDNNFKDTQEKYSNICIYYQLVIKQAKIQKINEKLDRKYDFLKKSIETILNNINFVQEGFQPNGKRQINKSMIQLQKQYNILQQISSLNIYAKIKQERLRQAILEKLKEIIKANSTRCQQLLNSKELKLQNITTIKNILEYFHILSRFTKLKDECQMTIKSINQSIKKSLQFETSNLQKITESITNNKQINPKIVNLDATLFKMRNYVQFGDIIDYSQKSHVTQVEEEFFEQFRPFFENIKDKIKTMRLSIKTILKFDEITNVIRKIKEFKCLKFIKQNFQCNQLEQFQNQPQKICYSKLIQPYKEIKQLISENGMKITKKLLSQINLFIEYDLHLIRMMSKKDYEKNIIKVKEQNYDCLIGSLMQKIRCQIVDSLNKVKENTNLIDNLDNLRSFKRTYSLFSYALKDENIIKQMNILNILEQFKKIEDNIIQFLQQSQENLLKQFKYARNDKITETFLEGIRKCCFEMKQFDAVLEQQYSFNEINKIVDEEFSKIQIALSNKLIYIFTQSSIDYKQLRQFFSSNKRNPQIVQQILNKINKYDQNYCEQIDGMKKYSEDLLFEDQNLNYIKLVKKAYTFYSEITSILQQNGQMISLRLSIQYFQSSLDPFVSQYQHIYQKIMQNIYRLKYKSVPQKIKLFFQNIQQLISKILPKDYQKIKNSIIEIPLNQDFNLQLDISQEKSIIHRIIKINQVLNDGISNDFTKVLDIFKKSSTKYYVYLQQEQKKRYLQKLREYFQKIMDKYEYQAEAENDSQKPFVDFFTLVPDSIARQQLQKQFRMIKHQLANAKKQVQDNFSRGLKQGNFYEIVKVYKQMNSKDRAKNKSRLKYFINHDFESIFNQRSDSKKQLIQQYQQLCSKYQQQTDLIKQLSDVFFIIKKQAKDKIAQRILFFVEENKAKIQKNDYQQIGNLTQNNQNIIHAYKYFIDNDNDNETSLRIIEKIENYFETVLSIYCIDIKSNQSIVNMHKWEFSEVQKMIRQQFYLKEIAMPIMNQLTQYKHKIKSFENSKRIQIILSEQHKNQYLSLITEQIINYSIQVSNFSFQQLFEKLPILASEQLYREQLQFLVQKIVLISKIEPIFKLYGLDKIQTSGNRQNISNIEPFKSKIVKEIKFAIQQTQLIKQSPQKQLPRKLICLSILCQLNSKNKDMQISNKLESIYNQLLKEISYLMGRFLSQIQLIKIQPSKKKGVQTTKQLQKIDKNLSNDSYHLQRAQATINNLIVAQKMQTKLQLFSQFIKKKSVQIMKQIQKNRNLLTVIISRLKIKELPEIKKIINKYQIFKPALNNFDKNQVQKKDAKLLFEQFKIKNQINENSQYTYGDYLDFEQSYNATLAKYLQSPSDSTISAISQDIHNSISSKHKNSVIGKMLGLYAIIKRNQLEQITFQPYPSQFLCISLLLQFGTPLAQTKLKKNIVSMLPGERKTIALAITACFLVLKQYKVYPICQSQYLANENQQHFKQLFQALKIKTGQIKYHALDSFCEQIANPGSTKSLIKNQLLGQVSKEQKKGDWFKLLSGNFFNWTGLFRQTNKVILIDQINIIFSDYFEGKVYEPIIQIKDEGQDTQINTQIINIFKYIYDRSKTQYLTPKSIVETQLYKKLIGKYNRISQIIKSQIAMMLNDVLDEQKINEYYQKGKKKKNLQNNPQNKNSFTGYQQQFAYIKLMQEGLISQKQIKNKLKLYIKISQYSVSQLFRNFDKILGVGGTLEFLSQKDKKLLNEHYKIQNMYYIPSIFEYRNITELASIYQSNNNLHNKIVFQIKSHFEDKKQKNAMIVFFRDQRFLNKFKQQKMIQMERCQGIKINYLLQQNQTQIEMVTSNNCLTLATKQFARGYNYRDNHLTKGLYIIQTYLPRNIYQLQQAKGRTARHGRPGKFNLFITIEELELVNKSVQEYLQNIEGFWRELNQKDYERRQVRRKQGKQKHNIIQYEQGGKIISYLQKINKVQFKPIEKSILLVFGISQNFINLTGWLLGQLSKYQDLMKRNQMKIKLRYQICYYGNYTNYTSKSYVENFKPHENILRVFKIRTLSDLKEKFKKIKPIQTNVINQKESMEIFFRHVLKLSEKQTVRTCFVWGNLKNYSWNTFKRTIQFKLHESSIRKQLGIQSEMKTCQQYLTLIKSKNIIVNCRDPKINRQKKQQFKQFEFYFREKMRQAIPYLKSIVIQ